MGEHESRPNAVQEHWDKQNELFERIKEYKGFEGYVGTIEDLNQYFNNENRNVCCIDERVTAGTFHYAGSGILDQENAAKHLKEANAKGVYSHAGCGAAAAAYERLSEQEKTAAKEQSDPDERFTNPEEYAMWWAKKVAKQADIPYEGHLPVTPNFHIARVVYYDGTGMFDSSKAKELPSGFVISRRFLDEDYAKSDLKLSADIAFGSHGFGKERFSAKAPFIIVVIGDPDPVNNAFSLETLKREAQTVAKQFGTDVIVDGFVPPIINIGVGQEELEPMPA